MSKLKKFLWLILILAPLALAIFLMIGPGIVESGRNTIIAHEPYKNSDEAIKLHKQLIVGDWHADSLMWNRDLLKRGSWGQVDIPRLQEGNVALQMFTTVTKSPAGLNYEKNSAEARDKITLLVMAQLWPMRTWNSQTERALYQSHKLHQLQKRAPEAVRVIRTKSDLKAVLEARSKGAKLIGALIGAEGGHALDGKIENLQRLYDAGFRMIGLQHFFDNKLGGSLHGVSGAGLSEFGRDVVKQMVAKNIIIDLAHSSTKVAKEVLAMVDVPVVVSHTGIFSNCKTKRNFPDELMKQIADGGGIIAIGYWKEVTCNPKPAGVAKSIISAIMLLGEDHVSLGSDYDGNVETSFDSSELAVLTHELLKAGVSKEVIAKVMGGNMARFLLNALPQ